MILLGAVSYTEAISIRESSKMQVTSLKPEKEETEEPNILQGGEEVTDDEDLKEVVKDATEEKPEDEDEEDVGEQEPEEDEDKDDDEKSAVEEEETGEEEKTEEPLEEVEQDAGEEEPPVDEEETGEEEPEVEDDDKEETVEEEETAEMIEDKEVIIDDTTDLKDKDLGYETIKLGENWFSLFHDTDKNNKTEYYMKLRYGNNNELTGGFKTDSLGNFIDELGNTLTSLNEIKEFLSADKFMEFWDSNDKPKALLIRKIIEFTKDEDMPAVEIADGETQGCQCASSCACRACCTPCCT